MGGDSEKGRPFFCFAFYVRSRRIRTCRLSVVFEKSESLSGHSLYAHSRPPSHALNRYQFQVRKPEQFVSDMAFWYSVFVCEFPTGHTDVASQASRSRGPLQNSTSEILILDHCVSSVPQGTARCHAETWSDEAALTGLKSGNDLLSQVGRYRYLLGKNSAARQKKGKRRPVPHCFPGVCSMSAASVPPILNAGESCNPRTIGFFLMI